MKMPMPVRLLRMVVLSNYDTGKCHYPKISILEILILNIWVPVVENADTEKDSTKKWQYSVPRLRNNIFLLISCWGPYLTP